MNNENFGSQVKWDTICTSVENMVQIRKINKLNNINVTNGTKRLQA